MPSLASVLSAPFRGIAWPFRTAARGRRSVKQHRAGRRVVVAQKRFDRMDDRSKSEVTRMRERFVDG